MENERRQQDRESRSPEAVRSRATLANGQVLEGWIENVSMDGAMFGGDTAGLSIDDEIDLVLVSADNEEVGYRCRVRHIDPKGRFWGAEFLSK